MMLFIYHRTVLTYNYYYNQLVYSLFLLNYKNIYIIIYKKKPPLK